MTITNPNGALTELPPDLGAARTGGRLPESVWHHTLFLMGKATFRGRELLEEALEPLGLRTKHFGALHVLAHEGPLAQQTLAERLRIDRTTMVAIVDDLERAGWAARRHDPCDRRAYRVQLTPAGTARLEEAAARVEAVEAELFAPLTPAEQHQLNTFMRRVCRLEAQTPPAGDVAREVTKRCAP